LLPVYIGSARVYSLGDADAKYLSLGVSIVGTHLPEEGVSMGIVYALGLVGSRHRPVESSAGVSL